MQDIQKKLETAYWLIFEIVKHVHVYYYFSFLCSYCLCVL